LNNEQDLRNMGGLRKYLPITFVTFLIGTLAIAGIPPLPDFSPKMKSWRMHSRTIRSSGRWLHWHRCSRHFLTFSGTTRASEEVKHHIHESPKSMTIPLMVLALLALVGGFMGIPEVLGGSHALEHFLEPVFAQSKALTAAHHHLDHSTELTLMGVIVGFTAVMILIAYFMYVRGHRVPAADSASIGAGQKLLRNKYYVDELYTSIITKPLQFISKVFDSVVEKLFIDNLVNGTGRAVTWGSKTLRLIQTGNTGFYIFAMVISIIILLAAKSFI
jgi:NADH-quinone oxidoreductase subunit L